MADASGKVIRSDWLDVESRILRRWKRKWVVLDERSVRFYEAEEGNTTRGKLVDTLPCEEIVKVEGPQTNDHVLAVTCRDRSFKVKCFTAARAEDWLKDLTYRANKKDK
eukprot:Opistho-1_new@47060